MEQLNELFVFDKILDIVFFLQSNERKKANVSRFTLFSKYINKLNRQKGKKRINQLCVTVTYLVSDSNRFRSTQIMRDNFNTYKLYTFFSLGVGKQ